MKKSLPWIICASGLLTVASFVVGALVAQPVAAASYALIETLRLDPADAEGLLNPRLAALDPDDAEDLLGREKSA
ncbi:MULTISPECIES: hypothetical protein [unclassified Mesorhizobium]|uniref:hypothetical protein n=1 Tax=unclassified Mesorhizobium TaxID=325217 RepID=UPI000FDA9429|nr:MULTISPECIES: hypothetical protein [unclassified Mesorhizobium]TGT71802.1 hypothetical protein EN809_016620 [Mesorhizobium sp. M2E.F.Ca.ET.166.01.1.1]TGV99484.1 hypothetical protein EN797_024635 [Mesorhizobium sp. M2E.F.Ca.ET.154.01.1.1]